MAVVVAGVSGSGIDRLRTRYRPVGSLRQPGELNSREGASRPPQIERGKSNQIKTARPATASRDADRRVDDRASSIFGRFLASAATTTHLDRDDMGLPPAASAREHPHLAPAVSGRTQRLDSSRTRRRHLEWSAIRTSDLGLSATTRTASSPEMNGTIRPQDRPARSAGWRVSGDVLRDSTCRWDFSRRICLARQRNASRPLPARFRGRRIFAGR